MIVMVIIGMALAVEFWRSEMRHGTLKADVEPPLPYS